MASSYEIRALPEADWPVAAGVAARAFFDEAFMHGMLGADPAVRLAGAHRIYGHEPWDTKALHLGAYAEGTLLGLVRASPRGTCAVCRLLDPASRPADPVLRKEWEFEIGVRALHLEYGEHAWVSRVAVEPQVHGVGVGSALVRAALGALVAHGGGPVVLECLAEREDFYLRLGFVRVGECPDPWAERSYLMELALPAG